MIKYEIFAKCDGCGLEKATAKVENLDPRHPKLENFLCKKCDKTASTIKIVMDKNTKIHGLGDCFGLKNGERTFIMGSDNA